MPNKGRGSYFEYKTLLLFLFSLNFPLGIRPPFFGVDEIIS